MLAQEQPAASIDWHIFYQQKSKLVRSSLPNTINACWHDGSLPTRATLGPILIPAAGRWLDYTHALKRIIVTINCLSDYSMMRHSKLADTKKPASHPAKRGNATKVPRDAREWRLKLSLPGPLLVFLAHHKRQQRAFPHLLIWTNLSRFIPSVVFPRVIHHAGFGTRRPSRFVLAQEDVA